MDTILFDRTHLDDRFKPSKWVFTDLQSKVMFKNIQKTQISDVIRAFLVNLSNEEEKNYDFTNDDLMRFLEKHNNEKICFVIVGSKRVLLSIQELSNIKTLYPNGINAL